MKSRSDVRLNIEHQRRLEVLDHQQGEAVSEEVCCTVDSAYENYLLSHRKQLVERLIGLNLATPPDPETASGG